MVNFNQTIFVPLPCQIFCHLLILIFEKSKILSFVFYFEKSALKKQKLITRWIDNFVNQLELIIRKSSWNATDD
jgi:hypothetical protein